MSCIYKPLIFAFVTLAGFESCKSPNNESVRDYRPKILQQFDGEWVMKGHVGGDSVEYRLTGEPVLNHMFLKLHMIDTSHPPQYEAVVFIGYDSTTKKIYAHWLDSFGGAFSVPHGTGALSDSTIEFSIPYSTATFRDVMRYESKNGVWYFSIDSRKDSLGQWTDFASYKIAKQKD